MARTGEEIVNNRQPEVIYIPSEDPYSLGYGGKLLEDEKKAISIRLTFDDGQVINLFDPKRTDHKYNC